MQNAMTTLSRLVQEYAPKTAPERAQFIELLRQYSIGTQIAFLGNQIAGNFTDGSGKQFLQECADTCQPVPPKRSNDG
jgi:hypothetical protein